MKRIIIVLCLLPIITFISCDNKEKSIKQPYVLMVSYDGFRYDYPDMYNTPNLDKLAEIGVKAHSLKPSYPSKTFPNHYTIATGLYPNNSGIVNNSFYAPDLDKHYSIGSEAVYNPDFYNGEPIWVTAEKNDITSASFFWVGSETKIKGILPTYWKKYQHHFPFEQRIDSVINWLQLPYEKRPHLILLYFHEPDAIGHKAGPNSIATKHTIEYLDSLTGVLYSKLNALPQKDSINLIITSDHGMAPIYKDSSIFLNEHLKKSWIADIQGSNPVYNIKAAKNCEDSILNALKNIKSIHTWKSSEIPKRLHYGGNPRTLDINILAKENQSVYLNRREEYLKGTHGYDNDFKKMHAIFYACGPDFKKNYQGKTFENVCIYPMICHIFNIKEAENDGEFDSIKEYIKN